MAWDDGLTAKQRLFCQHYLVNGHNGTQAALSAGYSENCANEIASENLAKPRIKHYVENSMREAAEKLGISQEYLLSKLKTNIENCESGKATREGIVHPTGVIGSITEINKMVGNYEPEKTDTTHRLERIEELLDEVKK